eukprot:1860004-Alexandrium_andersonii.AAC.1
MLVSACRHTSSGGVLRSPPFPLPESKRPPNGRAPPARRGLPAEQGSPARSLGSLPGLGRR